MKFSSNCLLSVNIVVVAQKAATLPVCYGSSGQVEWSKRRFSCRPSYL